MVVIILPMVTVVPEEGVRVPQVVIVQIRRVPPVGMVLLLIFRVLQLPVVVEVGGVMTLGLVVAVLAVTVAEALEGPHSQMATLGLPIPEVEVVVLVKGLLRQVAKVALV